MTEKVIMSVRETNMNASQYSLFTSLFLAQMRPLASCLFLKKHVLLISIQPMSNLSELRLFLPLSISDGWMVGVLWHFNTTDLFKCFPQVMIK